MVRSISQQSTSSQMLRLEWKVADIFYYGTLKSAIFYFCHSQWKLTLETQALISLTLSKISSSVTKNKLSIESFIEDENKKVHCVSNSYFNTSTEDAKEIWHWELQELYRMKQIVIDGVVTFAFKFMLCEDQQVVTGGDKCTQTENLYSTGRLTVDLQRLLDDGVYSDVTLKCGDIAIPAHRNILSVRSRVFAAMLENDMLEKRSGLVEISDVDPAILKEMIQFIYSEKVADLTVDTASHLYEASDKYAVEMLKHICSDFMKENLTVENACSILVLSDLHSDKDLKESVISFMVDRELMLKEDVWIKFCKDHPQLAIDVLNHVYKASKGIE